MNFSPAASARPSQWWRWQGKTLLLALKVVPRASRDEVLGAAADRLRVRLAAAPVDGAANDRLLRFLAREFRVPRMRVRVTSGQASRLKQVSVEAPRAFPPWAGDAGEAAPGSRN